MTYALTRLDSRLREAESGCSSVGPAQLVSEIQSTIQSLSIFEEMDNAVLVDSLKGRCSTLSSKAPSLKPKPLIGSPQSEKLPETIEDKTGEVEPPKGPSFASQTVDLLYTTGGYALAVPKFVLWTAPTSILSGAYSFLTYPFSKSTEESNSVEKTDVQSGIEVKPIVSTQISSSRAPVGLANGSNHCFVNAMRQFVYNTPLGEHLIGNLSQELFPVTKQDFENYQTQKSGTVMGGMKEVRAEVVPPELQVGQHDAQEALMHLFKFIEPARFQKGKGILPQSMLRGTKNPLFNWVERTSTYDLDSLPKGFRYDRFSASSKGDLQLDGSHPSHATNTNFMIDGPFSLPLEGSMQEAWDNYCNPHIQRHKSDYGAYLPDSVKLSDLPRGDRFTVSEKGQIKALPDKIGEYTRFREPPEHLIFNFNRFQYNEHLRTSSKRSDRVDVQETFSLNQRHIKNGTADYQIKSFILHSGGTGSGHYRAYVKVENQWYQCNDSGVAPVSQAEAERRMGNAYIFYAQRTTHSISTSSAMHRPKLALNKERTPEKVVPQTTKPRFTFQPYFGAPSKTRAPIGSSLSTTPFKGTTVLGSINQTDSAKAKSGSSYSCSAQSLGFLAKALNGETVNHEGLEPLLLDSQKKFDVLLEEQDTTLGKTQALHAEWGQQGVLNYVIENVESLYLNYHAFQAGKADLDDLTKYKTNICNDIVSKYKKDFFPGSRKPIFENAFGRFVDQRIDGSLTKTQFAEAIRTLISQDKALDKEAIKQSEKDTRRFYSGESRTITDVYSAFQNSFAGKSSPTAETFRLDADIDMRAGRFRKVLSDLTESSPRTPVGAAITCNDYTFALALVPQPDGKVMYQIFDSHGSTKLNSGNRNAFIYETTDEYDAARFLTKLIPYQAVDKRFEQYQLPDQNLFGYYTLRGAPSSNRIGNFFSALSGTFTGLFSRTSSSTSIKSPTVETLDRSSRE